MVIEHGYKRSSVFSGSGGGRYHNQGCCPPLYGLAALKQADTAAGRGAWDFSFCPGEAADTADRGGDFPKAAGGGNTVPCGKDGKPAAAD